jgi:SAM-dependent methyltransferase
MIVKQLDYTSERVNPEWYRGSAADYLIYLFHIASYQFARQRTRDKRVLDYGCGTGYGASMLAENNTDVVAIDIDTQVIGYARTQYPQTNLTFETVEPAESGRLPYADASFDTVVSFQVIEHVKNVDRYLAEIVRVLRPGGEFISATPDRSARLFSMQQPWNMHHVTEFSASQLCNALDLHFGEVEMLGMSGDPDVLGIEYQRVNRMKWISLPFTLPYLPKTMRRFGLRSAKCALEFLRSRKACPAETNFGFDESAIEISAYSGSCANLVAVARKSIA